MAVHPIDQRIVASGQLTHLSFAAPILVWNIEAQSVVCSLSLHKSAVQSLSFSPTGTFLASLGGADDNNLVVWHVDVENSRGVAICGSPAAQDAALALTWAGKDDTTVVTGGRFNLRVWAFDLAERKVKPIDVSTGQYRRTFTALAVAEDDDTLYACTESGDIIEASIEAKAFKRIGPKKRISRQISTALLDANGDLVVGSGDTLTLVRTEDMTIASQFGPDDVAGQVTSIAEGPAGDLLVGTSLSNVYSVAYGSDPATGQKGLSSVTLKSTCHNDKINDVAFPNSYSELFATCSATDIRVWHTDSSTELLRIQVPSVECNAIAFNPKGSLIISGWSDGKIRAFGPQSGKLMFVINDSHKLVGVGNPSGGAVPVNGVTTLAVTHAGNRLITGGADGQVRAWKLGDGAQVMLASMKEHKGPVFDIKVSADDSECLSASADGSVIKWSLHTFTRIAAVFGNTFFTSVCFHPDESQFITCGTDHKITFWDSTDMAAVRILEGSDSVRSLGPRPRPGPQLTRRPWPCACVRRRR